MILKFGDTPKVYAWKQLNSKRHYNKLLRCRNLQEQVRRMVRSKLVRHLSWYRVIANLLEIGFLYDYRKQSNGCTMR